MPMKQLYELISRLHSDVIALLKSIGFYREFAQTAQSKKATVVYFLSCTGADLLLSGKDILEDGSE